MKGLVQNRAPLVISSRKEMEIVVVVWEQKERDCQMEKKLMPEV
jgi:hypothetical protein